MTLDKYRYYYTVSCTYLLYSKIIHSNNFFTDYRQPFDRSFIFMVKASRHKNVSSATKQVNRR